MADVDTKAKDIRSAVNAGDILEAGNILCNSSLNEWNAISKAMLGHNTELQVKGTPNYLIPNISLIDRGNTFSISEKLGDAVVPRMTVDRDYCRNLNYTVQRGHHNAPYTKHF